MTPSEAIENSIRLLQAAEGDTNLTQMEALTRLAESWTSVATLLREME